MVENSDVVDIESSNFSVLSVNKFDGIVILPKDGIVIGKSKSYDLVALFNYEFSYISEVTVFITFEGDLFERTNLWQIDQFGAQRNDGRRPISKTKQTQKKCDIVQQFMNGKFHFNINSKSGSMKIKGIEFQLTGRSR